MVLLGDIVLGEIFFIVYMIKFGFVVDDSMRKYS